MTLKLLFTDPYSGHEIILLGSDEAAWYGFSYDPRNVSPPVPWSSTCPHCVAGRDRGLSIHLKREIRVVASLKVEKKNNRTTTFMIPTNGSDLRLICESKGDGGKEIRVADHLSSGDAIVAMDPTGKISRSGDERLVRQACRPQILGRCIKLIFSARPVDDQWLLKTLSPLIEDQKRRISTWQRWSPCRRIDWMALATSLIGERT